MIVTRNARNGKKKSVTVIAEAARRLGVTRTHLSLVLNGHRASRALLARHRQLLKAERNNGGRA